MTLGPVMFDLNGPALSAEEREMLAHPAAGGVILFTRNYVDRAQLRALVEEIHTLRTPPLLVAVDHEGGVVQRFRHPFTELPDAASFGELHDAEPERALALTADLGWLAGAELRNVGIDLNFAPVVDVRSTVSRIINRRAFHADVNVISDLAGKFVAGAREAGLAPVAKHFPGHGSVAEDSHLELPVDGRPLVDLELCDLVPFQCLIDRYLPGIMPAHVCYPAVDSQPASFSRYWLHEILRRRLGFQGAVFSDDITMYAARGIGDAAQRAEAALEAGCDMVLICNDRDGTAAVLEALAERDDPTAHARLIPMHGRAALSDEQLFNHPRWRQTRAALAALLSEPVLDLGDDERL